MKVPYVALLKERQVALLMERSHFMITRAVRHKASSTCWITTKQSNMFILSIERVPKSLYDSTASEMKPSETALVKVLEVTIHRVHNIM
jgi:hypothetical protein